MNRAEGATERARELASTALEVFERAGDRQAAGNARALLAQVAR
ncbi:hypothetical protein GCM10009733_037860 [Nonomuraea maheshkhaliensis]|uniref:Uncharacterized protein n=1 Tax=Nonomuraea maheshkhaliensis TaxID=419590 RepID=A0ABN2FA53_9ACTN